MSLDLIQAVELLIDGGHLPDIVPDNGTYSFEVDVSLHLELIERANDVVIMCRLAYLNQLGAELPSVMNRWLALSLASMTTSESVLSFNEESGRVSLHRVLDLSNEKEVGLLAAIEALISDAREYQEALK